MDRPSLALPPPSPGPRRWYLLPARFGLLLVMACVVLMVYRTSPSPRVQDLDDGWTVRTLVAGKVVPAEVDFPGVWSTATGGPRHVFAARTVVAPGPPQALWIERPRYALQVTWDGVPVARSGDPSSSERSARPMLVLLPPAEPGSSHELGLELADAFGEAGVLGSVAIGPVSDVHELAAASRVGGVAASLAMVLLAALPLAVAARASWRPTYTLYGLTVVTAGLLVWSYSTHPALLGVPIGWQLAMQRGLLFWCIGLVGGYIATFVAGHPDRATRRVLLTSGLLGLLAAAAPGDLAWWARAAGHAFVSLVLLYCGGTILLAVRRRVAGHAILLMALATGVAALGLEVLVNYGFHPNPSHNYLLVLLMMVVLGTALLLRDAETSERHERLVERFPDPLLTVDAAGRIVSANPAARVALHRPTEAGAALVFAWVDPEHHPRMRGHLRRGLYRTDHIEVMSAAGRWYESAATPVADDQVLLDLRDITARRDMDRGLLQAARAETAGILLGGLAHDFNNMLGTLLAHVGILKLRSGDADVRDRLQRMEGSIERAASLTKRLLTVARGTTTALSTCDFRATCHGAAELVEPTLGPAVVLDVDVPEDLPPVHGDPDDLEQVLVNLLVNARDAVGPKGRIRLVARSFQLADGHRGVAAMVEDDGPGVPEELRNDLFEPFVTTKGHGTGLGLAVARQILADHLGRLWHEPAPGRGARFLLALRHADAVHEAPAPLPKQRRVLVVDDEEVLLEAWSSALQDAGYEVQSTPDPVQAIEQIRVAPPDILVTDLAMAPLSGLEVARALQTRAPGVPVLVVSAFIAPDVQARITARGWEFLTKPVRAARLVAVVGHLRRQAERHDAGEDDITSVMHVFPALEQLSAEALGFGPPSQRPEPRDHLR